MYKDEVDHLYSAVWNGNEEDDLNALLKVYRLYLNKKAPRKKRFILKKFDTLNKQNIYSSVLVDEKGQLKTLWDLMHLIRIRSEILKR
jgi:hypothetical protein